MAFARAMQCIKERLVINLFALIIVHIRMVYVIEKNTDVIVYLITKVTMR